VDETRVSRLTTISTFTDSDVPCRTWLAAACVLATVVRENQGDFIGLRVANHRITSLHQKCRRLIEERVHAVIIRTLQPASPAMKRLAVKPNADLQIGDQALPGSDSLVEFHAVSKFHR
jgi:hypothetical protein